MPPSNERQCRYCAHVACCRMLGVNQEMLNSLVRDVASIGDANLRDMIILSAQKSARDPQPLTESDFDNLRLGAHGASHVASLVQCDRIPRLACDPGAVRASAAATSHAHAMVMRAAASVLSVVAALSSYFIAECGAIMNQDMLRNVFGTDAAEAAICSTSISRCVCYCWAFCLPGWCGVFLYPPLLPLDSCSSGSSRRSLRSSLQAVARQASTATSIPCMFSPLGRRGFDVDESSRIANLLDSLGDAVSRSSGARTMPAARACATG